MLLNLSTIRGHSVAATDGTIGTISDVLFDDASWMVRWLAVDTGGWLSGRKVLLPPSALGHADPTAKVFRLRLTQAQIEASPGLDSHKPVSRQFEMLTYDYYGWSPYWGSGFYMGGYGLLGAAMPMRTDPEVQRRADDIARHLHDQDEPHLHSAEAVTGYHIHATDGEIGHLSDFLIDDTDWSIHYLIVDTSNWWMGQKVIVSPRSAKVIRWTEELIYLDVDRATVKGSPPYNTANLVDRAFEDRMAQYYVRTRPNLDPDAKARSSKAD
jgi:sporulation protein YlmC with PRC-barrel domain